MRWLAKAALQKGLSALPAAERANYVFQRHVTRTLPASEAALRRKMRRARTHFGAFLEHGSRPADAAVFYEFGVGWDLAVPLCLWVLGVERQVLTDVRPNVRLALVNETIRRLHRLVGETSAEQGSVRDPGSAALESLEELEGRFGIVYRAPLDARATALPDASVDFVTSTNTFEHIPAEDVTPVLAECRRLVRPDGGLSFRIDLCDHFSYHDSTVSPYAFLRYSARNWRLINSSLLFQNRLRHPDYLRAFEEAGLTVVTEERAGPTDDDLRTLAALNVADEFARYTPQELGVRVLNVVLRPTPGPADGSPDAL